MRRHGTSGASILIYQHCGVSGITLMMGQRDAPRMEQTRRQSMLWGQLFEKVSMCWRCASPETAGAQERAAVSGLWLRGGRLASCTASTGHAQVHYDSAAAEGETHRACRAAGAVRMQTPQQWPRNDAEHCTEHDLAWRKQAPHGGTTTSRSA